MQVSQYCEQDSARWDDFVTRAPMATFLHTRRFLSYHGDRLKDVSLLLTQENKGIVGVLPAAVDPDDPHQVVSHPGITYGGLLHDGQLGGDGMLSGLETACRYYAGVGFEHLRYKPIPHTYHRIPSEDDLYALFRLGAMRYRCELSCAIDLDHRGQPGTRRRRGQKKAMQRGVKVSGGPEFLDDFWRVVEENLARKLDAHPVHTVDQIRQLSLLFPENIRFVVGLLDGQVAGGVTLFDTEMVSRAQYIASTVAGNEASVMDAVFEHCIASARDKGVRFFDFGTSNTEEGWQLSSTLYNFKREFGGGGVVHEWYHLDLKSLNLDEHRRL
jgi:hypothetical protein